MNLLRAELYMKPYERAFSDSNRARTAFVYSNGSSVLSTKNKRKRGKETEDFWIHLRKSRRTSWYYSRALGKKLSTWCGELGYKILNDQM